MTGFIIIVVLSLGGALLGASVAGWWGALIGALSAPASIIFGGFLFWLAADK